MKRFAKGLFDVTILWFVAFTYINLTDNYALGLTAWGVGFVAHLLKMYYDN